MIDTKFGWIRKFDDDRAKYIKPRPNKNTLVDLAIGLGIVVIGIGYIAVSAFCNGAHAFSDAEMDVLNDLGLLGD